ncbi:ankyrin [Tothia fuscella]|uniref:Ankyrin n=1 Tax=Tothia fuscella TaxID=1048955 RepID=A0A9P4NJI9_9PEZI|nr:ankyrin [Tothia fuscella]
MAEWLQTVTSSVAALKVIYETVEWLREVRKARVEAQCLLDRTTNLFNLLQNVDNIVHLRKAEYDRNPKRSVSHQEKQIIATLLDVFDSCRKCLEELQNRLLGLEGNEAMKLPIQVKRSVQFTLSKKNILKYERMVDTNIQAVTASIGLLQLLDQHDIQKRLETLGLTLGQALTLLQNMSPHTPETATGHEPTNAPLFLGSEILGLKTIEKNLGTARDVPSLLSSTQTVAASDSTPSHAQTDGAIDDSNAVPELPRDSKDEINTEHACYQSRRSGLSKCIGLHDGIPAEENDGVAMHKPVHHTSQTDLHFAVAATNAGSCHTMLESGANVGAFASGTALVDAVRRDQAGIVRILLEAGADTNLQSSDNWTILHHAVILYAGKSMATLLQHSVRHVNTSTSSGKTPLMLAADRAGRKESLSIAQDLIRCGALVNCTDAIDRTPLYAAIIGTYTTEREAFVTMLLEEGADVEFVRTSLPKRCKQYPILMKKLALIRRRDSAVLIASPSSSGTRRCSFSKFSGLV